MADLQRNIDEAEELVIGQLCSLAHLEQGGSLVSRKERLSTFLAGPSRRQRKGWLQFFMHIVDSGSVGDGPDFAVDYGELEHADQVQNGWRCGGLRAVLWNSRLLPWRWWHM